MNIKYLTNIRLPAGSIPHAAGRVKEQGGGLVQGGEAGLKAARAAAPLKFFSQNKNRWFLRNVWHIAARRLCKEFVQQL